MTANLLDLHPDILPLCEKLMGECHEAGLDVRLLFTYRSPAQQDALYAQGRSTPGKIVTSLKGDKSKHCFTVAGRPAAKAFDVAIYEGGKYITDGQHPLYKQVGEMGEALGLTWGGRWKSPFDPSHFQVA